MLVKSIFVFFILTMDSQAISKTELEDSPLTPRFAFEDSESFFETSSVSENTNKDSFEDPIKKNNFYLSTFSFSKGEGFNSCALSEAEDDNTFKTEEKRPELSCCSKEEYENSEKILKRLHERSCENKKVTKDDSQISLDFFKEKQNYKKN
ncbi:hypothetical protein HE1_00629 [Holospora elegans E1]|uniref:Uncharacterized protein n=1 Tax=Holospora elegans E1 TaxID=1427503 RepID=A0A023DXX8_9PROT|nr:hypothetical protein HE1_00629 [Holospora elegans E1]